MLGGLIRGAIPLYLRTVHWSRKMSEIFHSLFAPEKLNRSGSSCLFPNNVCHEDAFHYLLQAEARRSQRSGKGYHILLVYSANSQGAISPMHASVSAILLDELAQSLRETDYVGWYREDRIIGGVLTVVEQGSIIDPFKRVQQRLTAVLLSKLGSEGSSCFHFRLCRHHELQDFDSETRTILTV